MDLEGTDAGVDDIGILSARCQHKEDIDGEGRNPSEIAEPDVTGGLGQESDEDVNVED